MRFGLKSINFIIFHSIISSMDFRKRLKSSIEPSTHSLQFSRLLLRPTSSLQTVAKPITEEPKLIRSGSSIWRAVSAARCQSHLQKQTLQEPIRKNLSEKKIRLSDKRQEQQKKYEKTLQTIRRKCGHSAILHRQHFREAHSLFSGWIKQRNLEQNRYITRLLKLKA